MEEPRDTTFELLLAMRAELTETRTHLVHLVTDVSELRHDVRRIDGRVDQLFLAQVATLATALAGLVTALVGVLAN